jgi:hypothetical protein
MEALDSRDATLAALVAAKEKGLDLNCLLFARYLVLRGRLNEGRPDEAAPGDPTPHVRGSPRARPLPSA